MRLPNGAPPRLDWFGHNPFPFRSPKLPTAAGRGRDLRDISDIDTLCREVARYGGAIACRCGCRSTRSPPQRTARSSSTSRRARRRAGSARVLARARRQCVDGLGWITCTTRRDRGAAGRQRRPDDPRRPAQARVRRVSRRALTAAISGPGRARDPAAAAGARQAPVKARPRRVRAPRYCPARAAEPAHALVHEVDLHLARARLPPVPTSSSGTSARSPGASRRGPAPPRPWRAPVAPRQRYPRRIRGRRPSRAGERPSPSWDLDREAAHSPLTIPSSSSSSGAARGRRRRRAPCLAAAFYLRRRSRRPQGRRPAPVAATGATAPPAPALQKRGDRRRVRAGTSVPGAGPRAAPAGSRPR